MHIVIDAHLAVKQIDGISRYLIGLLSALPALDSSIQYTILSLPEQRTGLPQSIFAHPNVRRTELNLMGPSLRQHFIMQRRLRELGADLYHHPQFDLPYGLGLPTVITIHDLKYLFHPEFLMKRSKLKQHYVRKSLQYSMQAASQIIAVSESTTRDLIRSAGADCEKITVIHHGVGPAVKPASADSSFRISNDFVLFVGTRRPHKNIEGLINALSLLRRQYNLPLDVVIAGKAYADFRKPEALVESLGLQSHVHFLDFVSDEQLPELYSNARIFVLPSFYEGFGLPLLESMSYGTPVIGSNVSSIPEVVGEAGLLVDPASPEDIAGKIAQLLKDPKLHRKLSNAALQRAEKFSWSNVAKETLNVYIKALKNDSIKK